MRWIIPVLLLAALAAAWGGTAQAQANTRIILVPGGGGGNEVGWSASPAYGKLNDGRLPGKLFSDAADHELDAVRGYIDSSELMLRYIGNVDALLPSDDDIYDAYVVRISGGGSVLFRSGLADILTISPAGRSMVLDIPTAEFRMADHVGRELTIALDYDTIGEGVKSGPGGAVFAQIALSVIGMLVGLRLGPVVAVFGALVGAFVLPVVGIGEPEMWFFGTIIVILAVGGGFAWRIVLARG